MSNGSWISGIRRLWCQAPSTAPGGHASHLAALFVRSSWKASTSKVRDGRCYKLWARAREKIAHARWQRLPVHLGLVWGPVRFGGHFGVLRRDPAMHANLGGLAYRDAIWGSKLQWDLFRWFEVTLRAVVLMMLSTALVSLYGMLAWHPRTRPVWLGLLKCTLQWCGPAFCKWAQWSSARPDLLEADVRCILETLHMHAPTHTLCPSQIEMQLGASMAELFESFDEVPFASGAIAQVHRATLAPGTAVRCGVQPGQEVAIKVRHPNIERRLDSDFQIMLQLAWLASWLPILRDVRIYDSLIQFGVPLHQQLYLTQEALNLDRFARNFKGSSAVCFPRPLWPLVSDGVLVETFEAGSTVRDFVYNRSEHRGQVAQIGMQAYLQMMLQDNWLHADLHPGNILVDVRRPWQSDWNSWICGLDNAFLKVAGRTLTGCLSSVRLVILDAGMTVSLKSQHFHALARLYQGIAQTDGPTIAEAMLQLRHQNSTVDVDCAAIKRDICELFQDMDPDMFRTKTQEIVDAVFDIMRRNRLTIDGSASAVLLTTVTLEGWASALDPEIRIMEQISNLLPPSWGSRIANGADHIVFNDLLDA